MWDEVDPEEADYVMVPFTFEVRLSSHPFSQRYHGGDVMLPFLFLSGGNGTYELRDDIREEIVNSFLHQFSHYGKCPQKHIFIDNGDLDRTFLPPRTSIVFKTNASYGDADILALPQPCPDPGPPVRLISEAEYDASFLGHVSQHPIRQQLKAWTQHQTGLVVEFRGTEMTFFRGDEKQRREMRREAVELMTRSKFVLCPRGRGPGSRRLFEILALGRIPVIVGDSWKLPLESVIDYDRFLVRVPEGFVGLTGDYIRAFEMTHDLMEASKCSRQAYLEYFAPHSFRHFVEASLSSRDLRTSA